MTAQQLGHAPVTALKAIAAVAMIPVIILVAIGARSKSHLRTHRALHPNDP